jgi:hypothetical protein
MRGNTFFLCDKKLWHFWATKYRHHLLPAHACLPLPNGSWQATFILF